MRLGGRRGLRWRLLPAVRVAFRIFGRGWNDFYAWMLDRQERHNNINRILARDRHVEGKDKGLYDISRGPVHAAFLKRHGLRPTDRFLDFGCGYGRTAVAILDYLEPGNYVGVDLSAERIRMCHEYADLEGLSERRPRFVDSTDNAMPYLEDASIDVIFATSVFSHMPMDQWHEVLEAARRVLAPGGAFILNYHTSGTTERNVSDLKDYYYPQSEVDAVFARFGFEAELLDGWHDDLSPENRDPLLRMVRLRLADGAGARAAAASEAAV